MSAYDDYQNDGGGNAYDAYDNGEQNAGGYMDQGGFDAQASQGSQGGEKRTRGHQNDIALPVTVRMIKQAEELPDGNFQFEQQNFKFVVLMGLVKSVNVKPTTIEFVVDDGTGVLTASRYIENDSNNSTITNIHEGHLIRVAGETRSFNKRRSLNIWQISVCQDFNQLTHHYLNTIVVNTESKHGSFNPAIKAGVAAAAASDSNMAQSHLNAQVGTFAAPQHSTAITMDTSMMGLTTIQEMVFNAIKNDGGDSAGRERHDICAEVAQHGVSEPEVDAAITALSGDGQIYSTIDDFHWKSTSG